MEKITIKELSELAFINKATFYSHYKDIYDLSEQLENETIDRILSDIPHPEYFLTKPKQSVEMLAIAFISQSRLIEILFSDTRASILVYRLEKKLKECIYSIYPEYKNNLEKDVLLTILIQGCFYAFFAHYKDTDTKKLIEIIGQVNEQILGGASLPDFQ